MKSYRWLVCFCNVSLVMMILVSFIVLWELSQRVTPLSQTLYVCELVSCAILIAVRPYRWLAPPATFDFPSSSRCPFVSLAKLSYL